ncbi:MAG: oxaloacetate decarboxylase [Bacteroidetes bacterium]|nr:MAG: oxaloacetate decarboxylase [Bacteroidota bacterium]
MAKEIKLCLVYRDMWQSSGKFMPRADQLERVAEPIIEMGCFARVETNGGGFEQIQLLCGENPNKAVRKWTRAFNEAHIQTQMLERGLNGIRMSPVPADVRKLMFKVKKKQGTDIARSFDGLNNPQNLENSFKYAKKGGMIAQGALSLTHSPIHTVAYYIDLADKFIERGAQEICIKDMAGIGRPVSVGKIVKGIRERHPDILIQYHGHSTPGFSVASSLEAARNGADIIDVGMEPLSWGTGHADLLTIHEMLKDAGFSLPDINMKAYMKVRSLTKEFIDEWLGLYINKQNRFMNALLIGPGLPGGMMGSLMADLEKNLATINKSLAKQGKPPLTQDDLLIKLFDEVKYVWPRLGYPPLVTPFSQYVKNVALRNVQDMLKGKSRWGLIDENTWGMILGRSGALPGQIGEEIQQLANEQGREFFYGNPQSLYPDELELFAGKMEVKGWDYGEDDEELFEYAMHPPQYENFKSGKAKADFLADLEKRRNADQVQVPVHVPAPAPAPKPAPHPVAAFEPKTLNVVVNGETFKVSVAYDEDAFEAGPSENGQSAVFEVLAPLEGKFFLTKSPSEKGISVGQSVKKGDTLGYIEAMKVYNAIASECDGEVVEILAENGSEVEEDAVIIRIKTTK